ncbi:12813_t:CDS:2, partial [Acaulospora colombiana]
GNPFGNMPEYVDFILSVVPGGLDVRDGGSNRNVVNARFAKFYTEHGDAKRGRVAESLALERRLSISQVVEIKRRGGFYTRRPLWSSASGPSGM